MPRLALTFLGLLSMLAAAPANVTFSALLAGPEPQVHTYKTHDDQSLRFFLFAPDAPRGQPRPAVVWIHGGAWVGGTTDGFMPHARYCAARGLVGINLEYRLARPEGPTIADCIADCRSAVRYLRTHAAALGIDPARIAVAGDSAGGHLAAALGLLDGFDNANDDLAVSARPDALILYNPVLDLTEANWPRFAVGGTALSDKTSPIPSSPEALARARSLSPLFHVLPGQPPVLLMHGLADTVVAPSQAERFAAAALAAGNRCELILLPDTSHAFVVAFWKSPEPVVVNAVRAADRFLASLGWLEGEPTLVASTPPAWTPLIRKN